MDPALLQRRDAHFRHFGAVIAGPLDEAAKINNRPHNLPRLEGWNDIGERIEGIEHHPTYDQCGEAIYGDGRVIAAYAEEGSNLYAQALFYLSSHVGEAGHNCPVACTAGVVKVLQGVASDPLREKYLPRVLEASWERCLTGAQFLTEVQGGSDVGANDVRAIPDGEAYGTTRWRIEGEKWFCSNAAADIILMTARPQGGADGTQGLGLFLVPRRLEDGSPNAYRLRRLKDKLGTRSMASGEIDFDGAIAYAMGEVDQGFSAVMKHVISTSRLYNTVGCAGITRRAYLVASSYAKARRAFGVPIGSFPLVAEMMASMRAKSQALTAGGLMLASLFDQAEAGQLDEDRLAFLRVATNLAKLRSCQHSHRVVLTAIETLGGNGAIESFSILPRLLRDNVVYENWEGTHNVLVAQTVRDFGRLGLHRGFIRCLEAMLEGIADEQARVMGPVKNRLDRAKRTIEALGQESDPGLAALRLRPHAEALADVFFALCLAQDVAAEVDPKRRAAETALLEHFAAITLSGTEEERDHSYADRVRQVAEF
jgi:alkylation response protein AidB-like acyl-CoA dehydrogenase